MVIGGWGEGGVVVGEKGGCGGVRVVGEVCWGWRGGKGGG